MLELRSDPRFKAIAQPCEHAVRLLEATAADNDHTVACEVGVGIGATSVELCQALKGRGEIFLFDFDERLTALAADLRALGLTNFRTFGNSRRTYDSYCWNLAKLALEQRAARRGGLFHFAFLDGGHVFHHDAPAALLIKELLRPGGIVLLDDYDWSFAVSPTANPAVMPDLRDQYTDEQIATCHVKLVCDLFLDDDPRYRKLKIGYRAHEHRRAYRKLSM